jgi:hypothetical protein
VVKCNSVFDTEQYCHKIRVVDRYAMYYYFIFTKKKKNITHKVYCNECTKNLAGRCEGWRPFVRSTCTRKENIEHGKVSSIHSLTACRGVRYIDPLILTCTVGGDE